MCVDAYVNKGLALHNHFQKYSDAIECYDQAINKLDSQLDAEILFFNKANALFNLKKVFLFYYFNSYI